MAECTRAGKKDVPAIAALEKTVFSDAWSERSLADFFCRPDAVAFLWQENGMLCGYLIGTKTASECEIFRIAAHPARRRCGIARRLLAAYLDSLDGGCEVFLEVRAENTPAICLYASAGFEQIAVRRNYYKHPTEDAAILRLQV